MLSDGRKESEVYNNKIKNDMKTNNTVVRNLGEYTLPQRTKDEYFNATYLLNQWNKNNPNKQRSLDNFWKSTHLVEFMSEVAKNELGFTSVNFTELKNALSSTSNARQDRGGGTWMNKYLFVKFAMYLDPSFEYKVLKFAADFMIKYRDFAGDAYRELASAVAKICPKDFMKEAMSNLAKALNWVVFKEHKHAARNDHGEEEKQRELFQLEQNVIMLINDGFLHSYDEVIAYLRKKYVEKYTPDVLLGR